MSTKVKIDKNNTGYDKLEFTIKKFLVVLVNSCPNGEKIVCPNGEKIIMQMVQIGPKRVNRTFAQENQNEIDNF